MVVCGAFGLVGEWDSLGRGGSCGEKPGQDGRHLVSGDACGAGAAGVRAAARATHSRPPSRRSGYILDVFLE